MSSLHSLPSWNERVPSIPGPVDRLPQPITSFLGREDETRALLDLVTDPRRRLVTVTGPGGIGKTRLALQVAHHSLEHFRDGVVFVGLADVREPDLVPGTVAHALDIHNVSGQILIERVRERYRAAELLLVVDNLEHLLDAAPFLTEVLAQCPGITILATSRSRLQLSGEQVFEAHPLPIDLAVALFEERARAIAPDFAVTPESRPDVVNTCKHLDGLPLAIELAAARTPILPPRAIRDRLDNLMGLLSDGPRDAPDRHRGMRQTIAWSYDLLNEAEQALFRRLAVFEGGFTLEAATAVARDGIDVLASMAALESSSLVRLRPDMNGTPRFRMLETVREFALERLRRHGEENTARRAHANWVAGQAEDTERRWWLPDSLDKLDQIEPEIPNIRAALTWLQQEGDITELLHLVGSLAPLWGTRGYSAEGRVWLEWALPRSDGTPLEVLVVAMRAFSWVLLNRQEDRFRSLVAARYALTLSNQIDHGRNRVASSILSGVAGRNLGFFDDSIAWFTAALREQERFAGEQWVPVARNIVLNSLGGIELEQGRIDLAEHWFSVSMTQQQLQLGDRYASAGNVFKGLGLIARARGQPELAIIHFQTALQNARDAHDARSIGDTLGGIAGTLADLGQYDAAARLFGAAEAAHDRIGYPFVESSFAIQRALGLPEPWSSMYPECTVAEGLRRAQWERTAPIRAVTLDAEQAQAWWNEGRSLTIDEAVALIPRVEASQSAPVKPESGLTKREIDVLQLVAQGLSDREIAATLFISHRTVQNHVQAIYRKIDVSSRSAATRWAMEHDIA